MPQPESWSSDWRMSGFCASSSSCRIETGSAATQPKTRHIIARGYRGEFWPDGGLAGHGAHTAGTQADLVGALAEAVRTRAAGGRGEEPPRGAPQRRDRKSVV